MSTHLKVMSRSSTLKDVPPFRPSPCEWRLPNGKVCGAGAEIHASIGDRPMMHVCEKHFFELNPPKVRGRGP